MSTNIPLMYSMFGLAGTGGEGGSLCCPLAYRGAGRRRKSALDGTTDFLWKI